MKRDITVIVASVLVSLALLIAAVATANAAYSCKDVRDFACSHSQEELKALEQWLTPEQRKQARWCLKHSRRCS